MSVAIGKKIPTFSLPGTGGVWKLASAQGQNLVIYFYPRDNTTGCSNEAAAFADLCREFSKAGARIVGISADSLAAHEKFKAKLKLPFELLSDSELVVCQQFDVYKEKTLYGRKYMGIERSTFLLDAQGVLRHEWRKVKVAGHAQAVLTEARQTK
jgi:thioredoxin-dependent peroxiredoxin